MYSSFLLNQKFFKKSLSYILLFLMLVHSFAGDIVLVRADDSGANVIAGGDTEVNEIAKDNVNSINPDEIVIWKNDNPIENLETQGITDSENVVIFGNEQNIISGNGIDENTGTIETGTEYTGTINHNLLELSSSGDLQDNINESSQGNIGIVETGNKEIVEAMIAMEKQRTGLSGCVFEEKGYDEKNCLSANVVAEGSDTTYCSAIAHDNLSSLTKLPSALNEINAMSIPQGDAITLINLGKNEGKLTQLESCGALSEYLDNAPEGAIADIYLLDTNKDTTDFSAAHRFIAFNGEDGSTYVLDPIRGNASLNPQKLSEYRRQACKDQEVYVNNYLYYSPDAKATQQQNDIIEVRDSKELIKLGIEGKIIATEFDDMQQKPKKAKFLSTIRFVDSNGVQAKLESNLEVSTENGNPFDLTALGVSNPDGVSLEGIENIAGSTKFGIPGQHLHFSKPVKLDIPVTNIADGELLTIQVKHEGEDFGSQGLSKNPKTICTNGISSDESNQVVVENGKVTIYTCGASTFVVTTSSGSATITSPINGSTTADTTPTISGTGVNGTTITLTESGGSIIGTAVVAGGVWSITPSTPLATGSHSVCIATTCRTFTIADAVCGDGILGPGEICDDASSVVGYTVVSSGYTALIGGNGGGPITALCPTGQIAIGMQGKEYIANGTFSDSGYLSEYATRCGIIIPDFTSNTVTTSFQSVTATAAGSETATETSTIISDCPTGYALVGYDGRQRVNTALGISLVDAVRPRCAPLQIDPVTKAITIGTAYDASTMIVTDNSATLMDNLDCGPGKIANGFDGRVGALFDQFRLNCSTFQSIYTGDGCSLSCGLETGYVCTSGPLTGICTTAGSGSVTLCGNGVINTGEKCDDANNLNGDGCSNSCILETGYICAVDTMPLIGTCDTGGAGSVTAMCSVGQANGGYAVAVSSSNAVVAGTTNNAIGVFDASGAVLTTAAATTQITLDMGVLLPAGTVVQLSLARNTSGTTTLATITSSSTGTTYTGSINYGTGGTGFSIVNYVVPAGGARYIRIARNTTAGSVYVDGALGYFCTECGNSTVQYPEICDDGNTNNSDGCSSVCALETGYQCVSGPLLGACTTGGTGTIIPSCGNGTVSASLGEICDDGNTTNGDGCSNSCTLETGFLCAVDTTQSDGICDTGGAGSVTAMCAAGEANGGYAIAVFSSNAVVAGTTGNAVGEFNASGAVLTTAAATTQITLDMGVLLPAGTVVQLSLARNTSGTTTLATITSSSTGTTYTGSINYGTGGTGFSIVNYVVPAGGARYIKIARNTTAGSVYVDGALGYFCTECGNGLIQSPETCDDGNTISGDGCSSTCNVATTGFVCTHTGSGTVTNPQTVCTPIPDTDGDGLTDDVDIDDDNDGSLDILECPANTYPGLDFTPLDGTLQTFSTGGYQWESNYFAGAMSGDFQTNSSADGSKYMKVTFNQPVNVRLTKTLTAQGNCGGNPDPTGDSFTLTTDPNSGPIVLSDPNNDFATGPNNVNNVVDSAHAIYRYWDPKFALYAQSSDSRWTWDITVSNVTELKVTAGIQGAACGMRLIVEGLTNPTCDTDGDGITNDKDPDSDNDTCPDARESSSTGTNSLSSGFAYPSPWGVNGLYNPLETNDTSGAAINYTSTYNNYALVSGINLCSACGDGTVTKVLGEKCDDGNSISGDGCSSTCSVELGYSCAVDTNLLDGVCDTGGTGSVTPRCPNGTYSGGYATAVYSSNAVVAGTTGNAIGAFDGSGAILTTAAATTQETLDMGTLLPAGTVVKISLAKSTSGTATWATISSSTTGSAYTGSINYGTGGTGFAIVSYTIPAGGARYIRIARNTTVGSVYVDGALGYSCTVCGNGILEGAEKCDDSNQISGDGCSATCALEVPNCASGFNFSITPTSGNIPQPVTASFTNQSGFLISGVNWGNGVFTTGSSPVSYTYLTGGIYSGYITIRNQYSGAITTKCEQQLIIYPISPVTGSCNTGITSATVYTGYTPADLCSIGTPSGIMNSGNNYTWTCNGVDGGASVSCSAGLSYCGDAVIGTGLGYSGQELCDDGNQTSGDGCSDICALEAGYTCTHTGSGTVSNPQTVCTALIDTDGDGIIDDIDIDDDNDGILDTVEDAVTCAGQDISTLSFNGTAIEGLTSNSVDTINAGGFVSSYSNQDLALPIHLEFTTDNIVDYAMLGLLPASATQTLTSWNDGAYKFYNAGASTFGYFPTAWTFTNTATANELYEIDIATDGMVTVKIGGITQTTFQGVVSDYKLAVTAFNGLLYNNIVLTDATHAYSCSSSDTDGDGIINSLDPDSDGDFCPDARESSSTGTNSLSSGFAYPSPWGINGLYDFLENNDTTGATINYTSTYSMYALDSGTNLCTACGNGMIQTGLNEICDDGNTTSGDGCSMSCTLETGFTCTHTGSGTISNPQTVCTAIPDTDGDGIFDDVDIDDDNDGVLDSAELLCNTCSQYQGYPSVSGMDVNVMQVRAWTGAINGFIESDPTDFWPVNSSLPTSGPIAGLSPYSGYTTVVTNNGYASAPDLVGMVESSFWLPAGSYQFCGVSDDGYSIAYSYAGTQSDMIKINSDKWPSSAAIAGNITLQYPALIQFRANDSNRITATSADLGLMSGGNCVPINMASAMIPKPACITYDTYCYDTDNDGAPNSLDSDSDGDMCPDARESSSTGTNSLPSTFAYPSPWGINGLYDFLENNDTTGATINYTSTYSMYAVNSGMNLCVVCGNGTIEGAETCDDSNNLNGDGCSSTCSVETNWTCENTNPSVCYIVTNTGYCAGSGGITSIISVDQTGGYATDYSTKPDMSADGSKVIYMRGTELRLWERSTGLGTYIDTPDTVDQWSISADGTLISYVKGGELVVYSLVSNTQVYNLGANYTNPSLSANGSLLATTYNGNEVQIIRLSDGAILSIGNGYNVNLSSNGNYITYEYNNTVYLNNVQGFTDHGVITSTGGIDPAVASNGNFSFKDSLGGISYYNFATDTYTQIATNGSNANISDAGNYVGFFSNDSLDSLDTNTVGDTYVYSVIDGTTKIISVLYGTIQSNDQVGDKTKIAFSEDGQFMAMHGHSTNRFGNTYSAQVFYAGNPQLCSYSQPNLCGNGTVDSGEICDDSNTSSGDGCSNVCALETGYVCTNTPAQGPCVTGGTGSVTGLICDFNTQSYCWGGTQAGQLCTVNSDCDSNECYTIQQGIDAHGSINTCDDGSKCDSTAECQANGSDNCHIPTQCLPQKTMQYCVQKTIIGGILTPSDFVLNISDNLGIVGTGFGPKYCYTGVVGTNYVANEENATGYIKTYSGQCDSSGVFTGCTDSGVGYYDISSVPRDENTKIWFGDTPNTTNAYSDIGITNWTCQDLVNALNSQNNNPDPSVIWDCDGNNNVIVTSGTAPLYINLSSINVDVPLGETSCTCNIINEYVSICGNSTVEGNEICDDGNTTNGDGCSDTCTLETGYNCLVGPLTGACTTGGTGSVILPPTVTLPNPVVPGANILSGTCDLDNEPVYLYSDLLNPNPTITTCLSGSYVTTGILTGVAGQTGTITPVQTSGSNIFTGSPAPFTLNAVCGNSLVEGTEICDDGNTTDSDGCSATCTIETGYACTTPAGSAGPCTTGGTGSVIVLCGNAIVTPNEICDDGNTTNGDGCSDTCTLETGYNCLVGPLTGACTTGGTGSVILPPMVTLPNPVVPGANILSGTCDLDNEPVYLYSDLLNPNPTITTCLSGSYVTTGILTGVAGQTGTITPVQTSGSNIFTGSPAPFTLNAVCGNSLVEGTEICDDGNTTAGDGCSDTCTIETGYACTDPAGSAGPCTTGGSGSVFVLCGNAIVTPNEICDDGNTVAGDGCADTCTLETGYVCLTGPLTGACTTGGTGSVILPPTVTLPNPVVPGANTLSGSCDLDGEPVYLYSDLLDPNPTVTTCNSGSYTTTGTLTGVAGQTGTITPVQTSGSNIFTGSPAPFTLNAVCGNSLVEGTEICDDGNTTAGDGCSDTCTIETGYACTDPAGSAGPCTTGGSGSVFVLCGNAIVTPNEICDDGNTVAGDGCADTCTLETGYVCLTGPLTGACTTGGTGSVILPPTVTLPNPVVPGANTLSGSCDLDGEPVYLYSDLLDPNPTVTTCNSGSYTTTGTLTGVAGQTGTITPVQTSGSNIFTGSPAPFTLNAVCGNSLVEGTEICDDGNTTAGDGCSDTCTIETGYACTDPAGSAGPCTTGGSGSVFVLCGNAIVTPNEICDDGNTVAGDGCADTCTLESGYVCLTGPLTGACTTGGTGSVILPPTVTLPNPVVPGSNTLSGTCDLDGEPVYLYSDLLNPNPTVTTCNSGSYTTTGILTGVAGQTGTITPVQTSGSNIFTGSPVPFTLNAVCGNSLVEGTEICDDGNTAAGDGCSDTCTLEAGSICTSGPTTGPCTTGGSGSVLPTLSVVSVDGQPNTGTVTTTDTTPTLVGTGTPGDIITIYNASGDVIGTGVVDGSGVWTIIPTTPLNIGTNPLTATATNPITGVESAPIPMTVEIVVPTLSVVSVDGQPNTGTVTTTDTTPTLVGTGTPGDIITIYNASGDVIGTGVVDGSGVWTIIPTTPLNIGTNPLTATATNPITGVESAPIPMTVKIVSVGVRLIDPTNCEGNVSGYVIGFESYMTVRLVYSSGSSIIKTISPSLSTTGFFMFQLNFVNPSDPYYVPYGSYNLKYAVYNGTTELASGAYITNYSATCHQIPLINSGGGITTTNTLVPLVGTGEPNTSFVIKNASGEIVASGMIDGSGNWNAIVPVTNGINPFTISGPAGIGNTVEITKTTETVIPSPTGVGGGVVPITPVISTGVLTPPIATELHEDIVLKIKNEILKLEENSNEAINDFLSAMPLKLPKTGSDLASLYFIFFCLLLSAVIGSVISTRKL